jgi:hypothetical protein
MISQLSLSLARALIAYPITAKVTLCGKGCLYIQDAQSRHYTLVMLGKLILKPQWYL